MNGVKKCEKNRNILEGCSQSELLNEAIGVFNASESEYFNYFNETNGPNRETGLSD